MHLRYYSRTLQLVHVCVFLASLGLAFWGIENDWNTDLAGGVAAFAFGWLLFGSFLLNLLIARVGPLIGPFDFSKNLHPSRTEKVIMRLVSCFSLLLGGLAAGVAVRSIERGGLDIRVIFGVSAFIFAGGAAWLFLTLGIIVLSGFRVRPVYDEAEPNDFGGWIEPDTY